MFKYRGTGFDNDLKQSTRRVLQEGRIMGWASRFNQSSCPYLSSISDRMQLIKDNFLALNPKEIYRKPLGNGSRASGSLRYQTALVL